MIIISPYIIKTVLDTKNKYIKILLDEVRQT